MRRRRDIVVITGTTPIATTLRHLRRRTPFIGFRRRRESFIARHRRLQRRG
jgi:hypothetical protein